MPLNRKPISEISVFRLCYVPSTFSQEFSRNWSVYDEGKYDQKSIEYETSQMSGKKKVV